MYNDYNFNDAILKTQDKARLDNEIASLETFRRKVDDRLLKLKSHRNSLSVTYRIPAELLGEIMLTAAASYADEYKAYVQSQQPDWGDAATIYNGLGEDTKPITTSVPFPLVLSHISYSWRHLAQGLQSLWSTIPIALSKARHSIHLGLLKEWLKRVKVGDLDIMLTIQNESRELIYWTDYPPIEILELLAGVKQQWRSFHTTLPDLRWQEIIEGVGYQSLERLETLCLYRSGNPAHDRRHNTEMFTQNPFHNPNPNPHHFHHHHFNATNNDESPFDILENTPSLRSIILPDTINPSQLPINYEQLTHIELHTISLDDCISLLRDSTNLISFVFFGIYHMPPAGPLGWMGAMGVAAGAGAGVNVGAFGIPGHVPPNTNTNTNNINTRPESEREDRLLMKELTSFSVFSDPSILARLFDRLVVPKLDNVHLKSTTVGRLNVGLTSLKNLLLRSRSSLSSSLDLDNPSGPGIGPNSTTHRHTNTNTNYSFTSQSKNKKKKKKASASTSHSHSHSNSFDEPFGEPGPEESSTLRKLHLSIPVLGKCESLLKDWLREWQSKNIEILKLESWQREVEGFNELFWRDLYIPFYPSGIKEVGERKMMLPNLKKLVYIGAVSGFKLRSVMELLMARVISRQDSNLDSSSKSKSSKSNSKTGSNLNAGKGKSKTAAGSGSGSGSTKNKKHKYGSGRGYNHLGHTDYSWIDEYEKSLLEDDEVGDGPEDPDWDFEAIQELAKFESLEIFDTYSDFKKEVNGVDATALMFRMFVVGLLKDAGFKLKIITSGEYIH